MKILWFSNTPALGEEFLTTTPITGGSWIKSLNQEIQDKIELHIAFISKENILPFKYANTNYYPIYQKKYTLIRKYFNEKFARLDYKNNIHNYLEVVELVKPDLIHIHGTENFFGFIIDSTRIPIVISIQGFITVIYHKFFAGINKKHLNVSKGFINSLIGYKPFKTTYKRFKTMKETEKTILKKCNHVIGRTDWDRNVCQILNPNIQYYHNDELMRNSFYNNKWENSKTNTLRIFTTSGNFFYKGIETLCHAITLLIEAGFNSFEWKVAGVCENDLVIKVVKKQLKKLFPKSNLIFLGKLSEYELVNQLLISDLYIMPSHIENSPNNLCEAMILGMPCIAANSGGTSSLLVNKKEGILIQDGDPWSLAGTIINCNNNWEEFCKYGKQARIRALKRHNRDTISNSLMKIYQSILST